MMPKADDLILSSSPHIHSDVNVRKIMLKVILALVPALIASVIFFGWDAVRVIVITALSAVVAEGLWLWLAKRPLTPLRDLSALLTGLLLAMNLPSNASWWICVVGGFLAIWVGKQVFGGLGHNIFNPALVTRAFLFFAYPASMSGDRVWVAGESIFGIGATVDGLTTATPLGIAKTAATAADCPAFSWDMVTGLIPGSIGETSVIAIAIGAVILLWSGVASWKTMLSVFVGGALTGAVFNAWGPDTAIAHMPWYEHLCLGGFCFGAVFMATDPVTSSRTENGKFVYGFLIGAMAIIIRVLNPGYPEGMMMAILLMNIFAPLIDYVVVENNISRRAKRAVSNN